ncbi:Uncharacterised protein [Bordetella pertussis]|nr:Uncharacterised protein [Bordetella pertussis]
MYAKTKTHHRPTRFAVPLLTAIMVAALAGCGGGGNSSSKRASAPVTPTNPRWAPPPTWARRWPAC